MTRPAADAAWARARSATVTVAWVLAAASPAAAQRGQDLRRVPAAPVGRIGSGDEDRARLEQLAGRQPTAGYLLRSASSRAEPLAADSLAATWAPVLPSLDVISNSGLPYSLNDGPLWAGRGTSVSVTGGVRARWRRYRLAVVPTAFSSENRDFALPTDPRAAPGIPASRSPFSYPWRVFGPSIDYPLRFGDGAYRRVDLGESSLYASNGPVEYGVSSESQWWGPGLRNAIVMSNNAGGFGHLFARTARPVPTRAGDVEARYVLGALRQSGFFEPAGAPSGSGTRSLSAIAATLRPAFDSNVTVGVARAVFANVEGVAGVPLHALDVLFFIGQPNALGPSDISQRPGRDQVYSLFGRWVLPEAGFESYAEWARTEFPDGLRDALVAPNHTQGFTLGLQYARPIARVGGTGRVQAEYTSVERSTTFRVRPTGSYYTSRAVIQGYTQRGQVLGAAIGPGASSQWLAADYLARGWSAGLVATRVRWDNDAFNDVERPEGAGFCKHDVSVLYGARGSVRRRFGTVAVSAIRGTRLNTFFQNFSPCFAADPDAVDTRNATLTFSFTPPAR